jgi:hypothetical protein
VFAEDGQQEIRTEGFRRSGLSFARVAPNSAVVFERRPGRPGCFRGLFKALKRQHPRDRLVTRTQGPGIVFTGFGERVRGVADLRTQIRLRPKVMARTRDGIEVESNAFAIFTLGQNPDVLKVTYLGEEIPKNLHVVNLGWQDPDEENGRPYRLQVVDGLTDDLDMDDKREIHRFVQWCKQRGISRSRPPAEKQPDWKCVFDNQRVFAAIQSQSYDVQEKKIKNWTELPAHLAVAFYRDMLAQKEYDELYEPVNLNEYPILKLKNEFRKRMIHQGILAYQYVERRDGKDFVVTGRRGHDHLEATEWNESEIIRYPVRELKSQKVLRSRGIKVIHAGFTELDPSMPDVQDHYMFNYWRAFWHQKTLNIRTDHEMEALKIMGRARADAQRDMIDTLSTILSSGDRSLEALAVRVYQALEGIAADPETQRLLPKETRQMMRSLRSLLLPGDGDIIT